MDGTGCPPVPAATLRRRGKSLEVRGPTREVKPGCLFTQTTLDSKGHSRRGSGSFSYVATMETAAEFSAPLCSEAVRRGQAHADRVVVLGYGAPSTWNLAAEHFRHAISVVGLVHTKEHLCGLARWDLPVSTDHSRQWVRDRLRELDRGEVENVLLAPVGCQPDRLGPPASRKPSSASR